MIDTNEFDRLAIVVGRLRRREQEAMLKRQDLDTEIESLAEARIAATKAFDDYVTSCARGVA